MIKSENGSVELIGKGGDIIADLACIFKTIEDNFGDEAFGVISTALLTAQKTSDRNVDRN
jgi:hypothetical protein